MIAFNDRPCSLCEKTIKDGNKYEELRINGKYHSICRVCYKPIYYKVMNEIIDKIK